MAYTRQIVNVGTTADDGSGDYLRDALIKVNSNFENLWSVTAVNSDLDFTGSTISSVVTNEDIILDPAGTGKIVVASSIEPQTTASSTLGSSSKEFSNVYSDLITTDTLALNGLSSAPSSPVDGYLYYDSATKKFVGRVDGGWLNVQTVAVGADNKWTTFNADTGSTAANTTTDALTITGGTGITTAISGDTVTITSSNPSGLDNVVEDTTPQLGGGLDTQGNIVSASTGYLKFGATLPGSLATRTVGLGAYFTSNSDNSQRHYSSSWMNKQTLTANVDANNKKQGWSYDNTLDIAGFTHGIDDATNSSKNWGDYEYTIVTNSSASAKSINGVTGRFVKGEIAYDSTGDISATNVIGLEAVGSTDTGGTTTNLIGVKAKTDKGGSTTVTNRYSIYADNSDDTLYSVGPIKTDAKVTTTSDKFNVATKLTPGSAVGSAGDVTGDIAFDDDYIYYCTADHDGSTAIWKRSALSTW